MTDTHIPQALVAIKCLVFNHEPYLRDCLEGFVMQQTDFPFVAIVHDDASTDHSADIIREYAAKYPDIILPIYETENQYSKSDGSLARIMNAAVDATGAKYIAMCEGDDYWTDPCKLQKQVSFLESHLDYSLCANATRWLLSNGDLIEHQTCSFVEDCDITTSEIIRNGGLYINLASVVYRNAVGINKEHYNWWKIADVGDYPLCIAASLCGKVRFMADKMSVYRFEHIDSWIYRARKNNQLPHFLNEYTWLRKFDNETNHKYRQAVYEHLFPHMVRPLFIAGRLTIKEYVCAYHYSRLHYPALRLLKDIVLHYFPKLKRK